MINEMVYYPEHGIVDSPFTAGQLKLVEGVGKQLAHIRSLGYRLIVASNQPGIAKGHFSEKDFAGMRKKLSLELSRSGVRLDGEYYCLHHPLAKLKKYRVDCECRKPKPGLLLRAAEEQGLSLQESFMVGDGLIDVKAGKSAGCRTILISNTNGLLVKLMADMDAEPDFTVRSLGEAARIIEGS